ncbi:MAG: toll/interleukin-1 receptor domain-containing protein [Candidatus Kapaibacterium sp.]
MADIFISYSRKDSEHALSLAEKLRAEGIEVWIDQRGIHGAEQWATEIVEGIRGCRTFLLLLSDHSVESENVLKELSLAGERNKRILPVDIHPMEIPAAFAYTLAGLQRVALSDFDGILSAHKRSLLIPLQIIDHSTCDHR